MIEIRQVKLPVGHTEEDMRRAICKRLKGVTDFSFEIGKKSIDSRKKQELKYVYNVLVRAKNEGRILKNCAKDRDVSRYIPHVYLIPKPGDTPLKHRPVIVFPTFSYKNIVTLYLKRI